MCAPLCHSAKENNCNHAGWCLSERWLCPPAEWCPGHGPSVGSLAELGEFPQPRQSPASLIFGIAGLSCPGKAVSRGRWEEWCLPPAPCQMFMQLLGSCGWHCQVLLGMLSRTDGVCQALMALLHITKVPQLCFPPQHQLPPHMFSCENPALMGASAAFALPQVPSPEGKHCPGSACLQGEDFTG